MSVKYVEYLEADGNSYFELPAGTITWNNNSSIEVQYYHNAYADSSFLIGAYGQNGNTGIYTRYESISISMFEQQFTKNWNVNDYKANIQPYIHTIKIDKNGRTFDGVTEAITWSEPESWVFERLNLSPVRIFGQGSNQGDKYKYVALQGTRIYYVKIYNDDEVVHYFRPCLKGNTPCMYDEISQTFYYNQGTGIFKYGKFIDALYLFANNNEGTAENLGSYRLYNMKIEGDDPRDFQPVLDSNGVPCLMDKINKKYYYDKNGKGFSCDRYSGVSYIEGGYQTPISIGQWTIDENTKIVFDTYAEGSFGVFTETQTKTGAYYSNTYSFAVRASHYFNYLNNGTSSNNGWFATDKYTVTIDKNGYSINDTVFEAPLSNTINANLKLFCQMDYQNDLYTGKCKLYYFKIYQSNELVLDLIPVLDNEGTPCMYDLVTETFHYNQGTGTFSYGIEESECPKANYVEYISSYEGGFRRIPLDFSLYSYNDTNMSYEYKATFNQKDNVSMPIGTIRVATDKQIPIYFYRGASKNLQIRCGNVNVQEFNFANTNIGNTYVLSYNTQGNQEILANGKNVGTLDITGTMKSTDNLVLFDDTGVNSWTNANRYWQGDFYYFKMWYNGNLIHEILPCLDDNGEIAVYDTVTNKLYQQQVIQSNNIPITSVGSSYNPIKYIETNGTQYIDTGVVPTDNTDIDMVCRQIMCSPYITDGLVLNLDGILNTRNGHDSSSTIWEDLSGNDIDFNLYDVTINDTNMQFNGSTSYANIVDIELWREIVNNSIDYTVELCFKFNGDMSYQAIISTNLGEVNVCHFINDLQFGSRFYGFSTLVSNSKSPLRTVSADMTNLKGYSNTIYTELTTQYQDTVSKPTSDNFSIGKRMTSESYPFNGEICSIRIYNKILTDEERLYNHSVDVKRFGVVTNVTTVSTNKCIMNGLYIDETYKYKEIDTTVEPNLTASAGATLTLGSTYIPYLTETEIEQAINNGWTIE